MLQPRFRGSNLKAAGAAEFADLANLHCFLISTACAEERRTDALAALKDVCSPQVRVFERDVVDGARGCYLSHISVYEEMIANGAPWAVIFEDNIQVLSASDLKVVLQSLQKWTTSASWMILHLSLVHSAASLKLRKEEALTSDSDILRVERTAPDWYGPVQIDRAPGLGTTAYIISRDAALAIVKHHADIGYVQPIDDLLSEPGQNISLRICTILHVSECNSMNGNSAITAPQLPHSDFRRQRQKLQPVRSHRKRSNRFNRLTVNRMVHASLLANVGIHKLIMLKHEDCKPKTSPRRLCHAVPSLMAQRAAWANP